MQCTGKRFLVYFGTTGVLSTTNTFAAYLADSTGAIVRTLPTVSSPVHLGASTLANFSVRQSPTGTLTGNTSIFKGDSTRISVALTGTPPW